MSKLAIIEVVVNACGDCPRCERMGSMHVCSQTNYAVDLDWIPDECPLEDD